MEIREELLKLLKEELTIETEIKREGYFDDSTSYIKTTISLSGEEISSSYSDLPECSCGDD